MSIQTILNKWVEEDKGEQPMVTKHKNFIIQSHIRLMEEMQNKVDDLWFASYTDPMNGVSAVTDIIQDTIKKYKEELK